MKAGSTGLEGRMILLLLYLGFNVPGKLSPFWVFNDGS